MKNLQKWIGQNGGLDALKAAPMRVPAHPGIMRLTVEYIGKGPHGLDAVSVAHYFEQNGDLMRDPEMVFEVAWLPSAEKATIETAELYPYEFTQDSLGLYQEVYAQTADGKPGVRVGLKRDLEKFARQWDRNLKDQGFFSALAPVEAR